MILGQLLLLIIIIMTAVSCKCTDITRVYNLHPQLHAVDWLMTNS